MKSANKSEMISLILLVVSQFMSTRAIPLNIAYPDSYEMYSHKSLRTMGELKEQHMRQALIDVSSTINEVQNILAQDPKLPRLTRGEIEDLFELVTREEYKRSLEAGDYERAKHMRSLMLVLPFNANSQSSERLEELFTRTPATKLINIDMKKSKPQRIVLPASIENSIRDLTNVFPNIDREYAPTTFKPTNYVTAPVTTFHPKANAQTVANSINANEPQLISTYHPKSSVSKVSSFASFIDTLPKTTEGFGDVIHHDVPTSTFASTGKAFMRPNVKKLLSNIGLEPDYTAVDEISTYKPTKMKASTTTPGTTETTTATTESPSIAHTSPPELTPELRELLKSFGLLTNEAPLPPITAEPESYQDEFLPASPSALKDASLSVNDFKPLPKSVSGSDLDVKIGESFESRTDDFSSFKPLPQRKDKHVARADKEFERILKTFGLIESANSHDIKAIEKQTIQDRNDDVSALEVTDNKMERTLRVPDVDGQFLTRDMERLLSDLGINNINPAGIKTKNERVKEMKTGKQTTESFSTSIETQNIAPTMQNDLQKLHILLDTIKELDKLNANLTEEELGSSNPNNFKFSKNLSNQGPDPSEAFYSPDYANKNEFKRQTSASEPTKVSLDLTFTTPIPRNSSSSDSNDPEIDSTTTIVSTTIESNVEGETIQRNGKTEASVSSTTEESRNGNISDLASSFGGNDGLDSVSEEPLPPPRKNGFYFFSDWNSFLEVGDDQGENPDKVVVRFDPKIGDPGQFIPVKIP